MFFIIVILSLLVPSLCFADRICVRKSDNMILEYQTGNAPLGTLKKNVMNAGYKENEVEEKYITNEEYKELYEEKITKPMKEKSENEKKNKEIKRKQAENRIKQKLNLTEEDLEDLKTVIK